ncbi:MAG TPA: hypothetical protein VG389_08475 [Myxococcota bacterium]|jgi:hypothetical protein|nr:hypothetical protein [Myxococcota bacterium]
MSQLSCSDSRELLPAIASGAPLPLARRGEGLHHAERCPACGRTLARLRTTWAALGPDLHPDPEPTARLDPMVARAVHLARASESSVTAIPIVVDRGEPPVRRLRPVWRAAVAAGAALLLAGGWWLRSAWTELTTSPADRARAAIPGLAPEDAVVVVETELTDHPTDPALWQMLGQLGADSADAESMCRGFVRYLELRPDAPDRLQVVTFTADRLASLGRSGLCAPGSPPVPSPR